MCLASVPPPSNRITRRGVLAGAAVLAGSAAALSAAGPAAAARPAGPARATGPAGDLVIEGGTLLDPATGEVTEDAVVVIRSGTVHSAGPRGKNDIPASLPRLDAHGHWVLPGRPHSPQHRRRGA